MIDVFHVEFHPPFEGDRVSPLYLPQAGDPGLDAESASVPVLFETRVVTQWQGTWADQAHVALEYIKELRELIQTGLSQ